MRKKNSRPNLVVFRDSELPNMSTHRAQESCGFSVYRSVLIQWDDDEDERVLDFIDQLPEPIREQLVATQEHEGVLGLLWRDRIPVGYHVNASIKVADDVWTVAKSVGAA